MRGIRRVLLAAAGIFLVSMSVAADEPVFDSESGLQWLADQQVNDGHMHTPADPVLAYFATWQALRALDALEGPEDAVGDAATFLGGNASDDIHHIAVRARLGSETAFVALLERQNTDGGFGFADGYDSGVVETATALAALAGSDHRTAAGQAIGFLLGKQLGNGGYAIRAGEPASAFATALVLEALHAWRFEFSLSSPITGAKAFLDGQLAADGWGDTARDARILTALLPASADHGAYRSVLDALAEAQDEEGSWDGSVYTTALALRALSVEAQDEGEEVDGASVGGRLLDAETGLPIGSASVVISSDSQVHTRYSGGDGRFGFEELDAGTWLLEYAPTGYHSATQEITLGEDTALSLGDIALEPRADVGALLGRVTDAGTGEALEGAVVSVSGAASLQAHTDADGRYSLELAPGQYQIEIARTDYHSVQASVELEAGQTWNLSPALTPLTDDPVDAVNLRGLVLDSDGLPIAGVLVDAGDGISAETGSDGAFRLEDLAPGEQTLLLTHDAYLDLSVTVDLPATPELDMGTLVMQAQDPVDPPETVIHGRITDATNGEPLAGASVQIGDVGGFSNSEGRYRLEDVPPGMHAMTVGLAGYALRALDIEIPEGGNHAIDVALFPAGVGTVRVRDPATDQAAYPAWHEVEAFAELENIGEEAQTVLVYGQILPQGEESPIDEFPAVEIPVGGDVTEAHVRIEPGERVPVNLDWFVQDTPPGRYQFRIQVFDAFDGQLAHQGDAMFDIEATRFVERVELRPVPNHAVIGASVDVELDILVTHRSNEETRLSFDWRLLDPDDVPVLDGAFTTAMTPTENHLRFSADGGEIDLERSGEYRLEVVAFTEGEPLTHGTDSLFVASGVRLEIEDVAAPDTVTPEDGQKIDRSIRLEGVEEK